MPCCGGDSAGTTNPSEGVGGGLRASPDPPNGPLRLAPRRPWWTGRVGADTPHPGFQSPWGLEGLATALALQGALPGHVPNTTLTGPHSYQQPCPLHGPGA